MTLTESTMTLMPTRTSLRKLFVAVLVTTVVWVGGAAAQASAQPSRATVTKYGRTVVIRAFRKSGIGLYDAGFGAVQPVTELASTEAHQGWNLAIYIYLTPAAAAESYNGSIKSWRGAGMAAALKKNLVVAVVPKNRIAIGKSASPFALPVLITKTLASLPK
jgi:hypothetical protein